MYVCLVSIIQNNLCFATTYANKYYDLRCVIPSLIGWQNTHLQCHSAAMIAITQQLILPCPRKLPTHIQPQTFIPYSIHIQHVE